MAPDHSPPTASPWMKRKVVKAIGAMTPIDAVGGSRPTMPVMAPMITSDQISAMRRPYRSPT
ncbi:MAG: hypothetical protein WBA05_16605 [Gordonia sp. (in: high G+C Gram-positive bacteria)]